MISHLPHIVAAALVNESQQLNTTYPRAQQLAAGGFRDITQLLPLMQRCGRIFY